jgi:hypothetical protein
MAITMMSFRGCICSRPKRMDIPRTATCKTGEKSVQFALDDSLRRQTNRGESLEPVEEEESQYRKRNEELGGKDAHLDEGNGEGKVGVVVGNQRAREEDTDGNDLLATKNHHEYGNTGRKGGKGERTFLTQRSQPI